MMRLLTTREGVKKTNIFNPAPARRGWVKEII